jgi:hypothetical protein
MSHDPTTRTTRRGGAALLAFLAALPGAAFPNDATLSDTREALEVSLEVPAAGWFRLALDARLLAAAGRGELALRTPSGTLAPLHLLSADEEGAALPVAVAGVTRSAEGSTLLLDLGPRPPLHDRLQVSFPRFTVALGCRLAASDDQREWRELAVADLFRLDDGSEPAADGLARGELAYPPSGARWLRLTWPGSAGEPALSALSARAAGDPARVLQRPVAATAAATAFPHTERLLLALPGDGHRVEGLVLVRPAGPHTGTPDPRLLRLFVPSGAGWRAVPVSAAAGSAAPGELVLRFPRGALAGPPGTLVRLDLHGETPGRTPPAAAPAPASASEDSAGSEPNPDAAGGATASGPTPPAPTPRELRWLLTPATLVARAEIAGSYTLLVGPEAGGPGVASGDEERPATGETVTTLTAGAAVARVLPPLPASAVAPGARLPEASFARRFAVEAPDAWPGVVVRVPLGPEVLSSSVHHGADLRLTVGERQLPFVRRPRPTPTLLALGVGPTSEPPPARERPAAAGAPTSWWSLPLPVPGQHGVQLVLASPHGPFSRSLAAFARDLAPAPGGEPWQRLAATPWTCGETPPFPCPLELELRLGLDRGRAPAGGAPPTPPRSELVLAFDDGDNAPLPAVAAELWQRDDELLFVWPDAAGHVELVVGSPEVAAPRYDLELVAERLLARPFVTATLEPRAEDPGPARLRGTLALGALGAAAVVLLVLLSRLLPGRGNARETG